MTTDLGRALSSARACLAASSDTPLLDAQALLAAITGRPRAWVLAHPEAPLTPDQSTELEIKLARLAGGAPLPYVLGRWEFFGLELEVGPAALIPRPETELLVERGLAWLRAAPGRRRFADAGTGTGAIAIALCANLANLSGAATDLSAAALGLARRNLARHGLAGRVQLVQCDLLSALSGPFDLITANLPYIPSRTLAGLDVSRREPRLALDGGPDGLALIRRLLADAPRQLAPGGRLLLEIEAGQGPAALELARRAFPRGAARLHPDLAGRDRLIEVETDAD